MQVNQIRTDLALEARECVQPKDRSNPEIHGVEVYEYYREKSNTSITKVCITTKNGAKAIGKPMGTYLTIEAPEMTQPDEASHLEIAKELSVQLMRFLPNLDQEKSVLVVGLGNRQVTADALGPNVIDNLCVTRHILRTYTKAAYENAGAVHFVSALAPGVMAQTGMEPLEIIKGVVAQIQPDFLLVIDALAAQSTKRLNTTIQLTDTGIQPGSGVGNHRTELSKKTLGIPVIAIGVPTVIDGATILKGALNSLKASDSLLDFETPRVQSVLNQLSNMFVTNKDIDATIKQLSFIISEAINRTFVPV